MSSITDIHAREILETKRRLNEIYHLHTGQELRVIEEALERDRFLSGKEAEDFGIIDEVVSKRPVTEKKPEK